MIGQHKQNKTALLHKVFNAGMRISGHLTAETRQLESSRSFGGFVAVLHKVNIGISTNIMHHRHICWQIVRTVAGKLLPSCWSFLSACLFAAAPIDFFDPTMESSLATALSTRYYKLARSKKLATSRLQLALSQINTLLLLRSGGRLLMFSPDLCLLSSHA